MKKYILLLIVLNLLFSSCEEVIKLDLPTGYKRLIVEGWVTDQPGPYIVKLTKTQDYSFTYNDTVVFEQGATVIIKDDLGNIVELNEIAPGVYQTDSAQFVGQIGRSYTLNIKTDEGDEYSSNAELLQAVPTVDSIFYIIDRNDTDEKGDPFTQIFISFKDPAETEDYYLWKMYFNGNFDPDVHYLADKYINGQTVRGLLIINGYTYPNFKFFVEQLSLTKEAYEFWALVQQQTQDIGSPYDLPPAPILGNIYNVNDRRDYALGFFGASSVTRSKELNAR